MTALTAKLGEVAELRAGVGFPERLQGRTFGDYPLAKVGDISRVGRSGKSIISRADHYVDERDLSELNAKPIPQGSVLFAKIGEAIRQNHRAVAGCSLLVDNNAMAAIPTDRIASRYLYQFLRTIDFYRLASATTVPALRKSVLSEIEIPLPPLAEQKQIAGILDAADALRAKRREALAQLDTLLQAIFLDLFGDPVINTKGWKIKTLEESGTKIKVGPFGSLLHVSDYIAGGVPLVNPKHMVDSQIVHGGDETVSEKKASQLEDYRLKIGDVLVARRGEMGRCVIVQAEHSGWLCGTGSFYVRTGGNGMLPEFLAACISSQPMRKFLEHLSGGAIMPSLSGTQIKNLRIPIPPIEKQAKFVRTCQSISDHLQQQSQHLAELDTLFASLQSRAFRGELNAR